MKLSSSTSELSLNSTALSLLSSKLREQPEDSRHQELKEDLNYSWCAEFVINQKSMEEQPVALMTRMARKARSSTSTPLSIKKVGKQVGTSTPQGENASSPADPNHSFTMLFPVDHIDDAVSLSDNQFGDEAYDETLDALDFEEDVEGNLDLLSLEVEIPCSPLESDPSLAGIPPSLGSLTSGSRC